MQNWSQRLLSEIVTYTKYARFRPDLKRRETWEEIVDRYIAMMLKRYCGIKYEKGWKRKKLDLSGVTSADLLAKEIIENSKFLYDKRVLPSMRALQFAGPAVEKTESRVYNCFSEDTCFITSKGVKSFKDFKNKNKCVVLTHTGSWKNAIVTNYGEQELYTVTLKKGRSIKKVKVTKNHKWLLRNGEKTINLKVGDVLHKTPNLFDDFNYEDLNPMEKLYWCYGFVYGDGTRVKNSKGEYSYSMLRLCGEDVQFENRFLELGFKSSTSTSLKGDIIIYTGKYLKTTPDLSKDPINLIKSFVHGYCQADARKNKNYKRGEGDSAYHSIQSSEEDHIEFIHKAFEMVGLYITGYTNLTGQKTNYGTRPYTKDIRFYSNMSGKHAQAMWSVSDIEYLKKDEVWCLEVEDDHSFVLSGGIVTGNCGYLPIDSYTSFAELMFLLLGGTGIGYSVQERHIEKLPYILKPIKTRKYLIGDSIEGWSDAVKALLKSYFGVTRYKPKFDYSDIREKGEQLVTAGGRAPGPDPLRLCLTKIEVLLNNKEDNTQLTSLECHDICCHIADAVLAGGIRRAAMIALFSFGDIKMATCKHGAWWEVENQRGRANNSAVIVRNRVTRREFEAFWKLIKDSKSGEPGISWTNDPEYGFNPCHEISLRPFTFCNLCEINAGTVKNQEDFNERVKVAAFFGTLQAGFTDFHYLRTIWRKNTEKDSLIGVGMTGIGDGKMTHIDLTEGTKLVSEENIRVAEIIGIKPAARTTTIKPSGTTSCVLGTASGIHAWHSEYIVRNMQCRVGDDLYNYFNENHPELIKIMDYQPDDAVIGIPLKAPKGAILRDEQTAIEFLERVKRYNVEWVQEGHVSGPNFNNVSATVDIRDDEWDDVRDWMWLNRKTYSGISVIPFDGGSYADAPFQVCTKYEYDKRMKYIKDNPIDLTKIKELTDNTNLKGELACAGGACELKF